VAIKGKNALGLKRSRQTILFVPKITITIGPLGSVSRAGSAY
jgi:hypothetical protein